MAPSDGDSQTPYRSTGRAAPRAPAPESSRGRRTRPAWLRCPSKPAAHVRSKSAELPTAVTAITQSRASLGSGRTRSRKGEVIHVLHRRSQVNGLSPAGNLVTIAHKRRESTLEP